MKTIVDLVTSLKTYFIGKDTTAKQAVEANIAPVETDATASVGSYAIGDQLFLLDVLYDVTATITAGDALTVGTNIAVADTVSEQIADAKSDISAANTTIGAHTTAIGNIEASISDTEASTTAAAAYAIGDQFSINGVLYEATAAIAIGDTITVGTNAKIADTLVDQIGAVNSALSNKQDSTLASAVTIGGTSRTTVEGALGALADSSYLVNNLTTNSSKKALTAAKGKTLADMHKVSSFEVSTSSWTQDTTSQSGTTLQKKTIALSHCYVDSPSVDIGAASGSVLPTTAQQTAYNLLQYVTVDSAIPCLYLYASDVPTDAFYINVEGVD